MTNPPNHPAEPSHIHVERHGTRTTIIVDGKPFPFAHAHPTVVNINHKEAPGVTITLIAKRVTVDDDMFHKLDPSPTPAPSTPTPEQKARDEAERDPTPRYEDGRPKYHRHFGDYAIYTDEECQNPATPRRVYVFDAEDLDRHEQFIIARTRQERMP